MKIFSTPSTYPFGFIIMLLIIPVFLNCSGEKENIQDQLLGKWKRTDGNYTLDISEVKAEGELTVAYLNPQPINVGRSAWRMQEDVLQVYVELQDENYPGSLYKLFYNDESGTLDGTYYQAVAKQTYEVQFTKVK